MKPSQINKRIKDLEKMPEVVALKAAQEAAKVHLGRIEELRAEKAAIINEYGTGPHGQGKLARIRKSGKLDEAAFMEFRKAIYAEPDEDKRLDMIDAKLTELGL